jgi:ABC-type multidrug transport system ATPase subunit
MTTPIAAEELSVHYGRRTALDRVSLAVEPGEVYALLGLNGAGKSSLVRCLLGSQRPAAGRARLLGRDAWRERAAVLAEVGVVPEEPDAPRAMTAAQLSRFCSSLYPRWDAEGVAERLRRCGVPLDLPFGRLSKGQKGQVNLALALGHAPRLLLLDDPTLGLDPLARRAVFEELIGDLADRGTTVFLTTHDLAAVEGIADRIGVLHDGRLLLDEELELLKRRFRRLRFPGVQAEAGEAAGRAAAAGGPAGRATVPLASTTSAAPLAEIAGLAPLAVTARPWGVEAVVSNFDEVHFATDGPGGTGAHGRARPEVSALSIEEIFVAVVGHAQGGTA